MRKTLILVLFISLAGVSFPQAGSLYFRAKLDSILSLPVFDSTQIAISIYDFTDGVTVFNKNEKLLLRPASTLKILTSAAALYFLTPEYQFKTGISYTGEIKDSTLNGNIFIEGGFDPEFTTDGIDSFAVHIKKAGINKINGNIYADISRMDSLYWGKGWMWDDDPAPSFPYMNSLPINKNSIKVITSPSGAGEKAGIKTIPETSFVLITNKTLTAENDTSAVSALRNWVKRKNEITVSGKIGIRSAPDTSEVNIIYPEKYFLTLFTETLKRHNIIFTGGGDTLRTPADAKLIFTFSAPIGRVITRGNKESDNLNAEMLLRAAAYEKLKRTVSAADGIKYTDSLIALAGMKKGNYRIVDGSGLSFYNLISSELIIEVLKFIHSNPRLYPVILNSLPIAGVDGTLSERMKEFAHLKNIYAKTGTMSGTSCLAGYLYTTHGHLMAFSIAMQNFTGSSKRMRSIQDDICRAIYLIKSDKDE